MRLREVLFQCRAAADENVKHITAQDIVKTKEEIEERHKEMMADILEYMAKQKSRSRKVEAASMAKAKTALKAVFPALSPIHHRGLLNGAIF